MSDLHTLYLVTHMSHISVCFDHYYTYMCIISWLWCAPPCGLCRYNLPDMSVFSYIGNDCLAQVDNDNLRLVDKSLQPHHSHLSEQDPPNVSWRRWRHCSMWSHGYVGDHTPDGHYTYRSRFVVHLYWTTVLRACCDNHKSTPWYAYTKPGPLSTPHHTLLSHCNVPSVDSNFLDHYPSNSFWILYDYHQRSLVTCFLLSL